MVVGTSTGQRITVDMLVATTIHGGHFFAVLGLVVLNSSKNLAGRANPHAAADLAQLHQALQSVLLLP